MTSMISDQNPRLRIWGSGVRISSGAPALTLVLELRKIQRGNDWGNSRQDFASSKRSPPMSVRSTPGNLHAFDF